MSGFRAICCIFVPQYRTAKNDNNRGILHMILQERTNMAQRKAGSVILSVLLTLICLVFTLQLLFVILVGSSGSSLIQGGSSKYNLLDRFDNYIVNLTSNALDGIFVVEKVYMLNDSDQVAPEPNQSLYGTTQNPEDLQFAFNAVQHRLNGEGLLFTTETPVMENSDIHYYLDDTIFAVTWKQLLNGVVYTFSEVKIEHPSQFRRFLSDGTYGSDKQYLTSQMAASVNAVVASSGDFYKYRHIGLLVYNGKVERYEGNYLDNCFIDDQGELIFTRPTELLTREELEEFVKERNIRFSLSFGPILVENGESCVKQPYPLGEINGNYARAALCQMGPLHYVLVTANSEGIYVNFPTVPSFADTLASVGIDKAYALDGGQTATIVMNDQVINEVSYGSERYISDIIYFATAIPETKK